MATLATEESKNFRERNIFMVLMPNKAVLQKNQEQPKKKEKPVTEVSASFTDRLAEVIAQLLNVNIKAMDDRIGW
ncbi:Translation initiation factor IF-3, N-terminal domain [Musa troglodytarum]|uniref:Translation initiation factor IF-3, N-terminal domain n=1 Tax=Musa troglodytarum TaxID=320322 RepID=A0A9E7G8G6_9LILI|nr:Translation initiation factor IF-3, N-terminal domain [Musa troglodytarum]